MYELLISGGPSDGKILGEFADIEDAADYIKGYNMEDHHPDEILVLRKMEV